MNNPEITATEHIYFRFTDQQKLLLAQLIAQRETLLLNWRFNDPKKREEEILQHAALSAERQVLQELFHWDEERAKEAEAHLQDILQQQLADRRVSEVLGPHAPGFDNPDSQQTSF